MPTNRLEFNTILQNQNNKYITINEAFNFLEAVGSGYIDGIISADTDTTTNGSLYIVDNNATGALANHKNKLAYRLENNLVFLAAKEGMLLRSRDASTEYLRGVTTWQSSARSGNATEQSQTFSLNIPASSKVDFQLSVPGATVTTITTDQTVRLRAYADNATRSGDAVVGTNTANSPTVIDYGIVNAGVNSVFKRIPVASTETGLPMAAYNILTSAQTINLTVGYIPS